MTKQQKEVARAAGAAAPGWLGSRAVAAGYAETLSTAAGVGLRDREAFVGVFLAAYDLAAGARR